MSEHVESTVEPALIEELTEAGQIVPAGVPGVYGFSAGLEALIERLQARLTAIGRTATTEALSFPPILSRATLEKSGYLDGFPHLFGTVHCFEGSEAERDEMLARVLAGEDYSDLQAMSDVVLAPAVCYHVYPLFSGQLSVAGRDIDVQSFCFRHERSAETGRLQAFRVREFVHAGYPDDCIRWRDRWIETALEFCRSMGLEADAVPAADPFFGAGRRLLGATQRKHGLKFEVRVPIISVEAPTAIASFNYHRAHFGERFDFSLPDGSPGHTACVGFGLERVAFALLRTHGHRVEDWPRSLRTALWK
jgi:seryl-tRNA synthetase